MDVPMAFANDNEYRQYIKQLQAEKKGLQANFQAVKERAEGLDAELSLARRKLRERYQRTNDIATNTGKIMQKLEEAASVASKKVEAMKDDLRASKMHLEQIAEETNCFVCCNAMRLRVIFDCGHICCGACYLKLKCVNYKPPWALARTEKPCCLTPPCCTGRRTCPDCRRAAAPMLIDVRGWQGLLDVVHGPDSLAADPEEPETIRLIKEEMEIAEEVKRQELIGAEILKRMEAEELVETPKGAERRAQDMVEAKRSRVTDEEAARWWSSYYDESVAEIVARFGEEPEGMVWDQESE